MPPANAAIRDCRESDLPAILAIVNAAAEAYRGNIPADCWHEPYMDAAELRGEIEAGVAFLGYQIEGALAGVMGIQPVRNVELIRHAYVSPQHQGKGIGRSLLQRLNERARRPILIGTWAAATWAIGFYQANGFRLVPPSAKDLLLSAYWSIPERQVEASVVLAAPPLTDEEAVKLAS